MPRQLGEGLPGDQRLPPGAVQHEARLAIPIPERQSDDAVDGQTEESAGAGDHSMARRWLGFSGPDLGSIRALWISQGRGPPPKLARGHGGR